MNVLKSWCSSSNICKRMCVLWEKFKPKTNLSLLKCCKPSFQLKTSVETFIQSVNCQTLGINFTRIPSELWQRSQYNMKHDPNHHLKLRLVMSCTCIIIVHHHVFSNIIHHVFLYIIPSIILISNSNMFSLNWNYSFKRRLS